MQELGFNKIYKTGNPQIDVLGVEIQRAQSTASMAAARAEGLDARVQRLDSEILRHQRRTLRGNLIALVLTVTLVGGCAWWANDVLNEQGVSLATLPMLSQTVDSLGNRLNTAEDRLAKLSDDWSSMASRMSSLEKKVSSNVLPNETVSLQQQIARLQSDRAADAEKIAALEGQVRSLQAATLRNTLTDSPLQASSYKERDPLP